METRERFPGQLHRIIADVARQHGYLPSDIVSKGQVFPLLRARREAYYRCLAETVLSVGIICRLFDRDHSTVMHGASRYAALHNLPPARIRRRKASAGGATAGQGRPHTG